MSSDKIPDGCGDSVAKYKAIFLDRDGTINIDKGYVHRVEDLEILPGVAQALKMLRAEGFLLIVVTNQSGVARGYYPMEAVHRLHFCLDRELEREGAKVDGYYVCPHHPDGEVIEYAKVCDCRKPMSGMLFQAAKDHSIELSVSYMIGDKLTDVEAGTSAGCRAVYIAGSGGYEPVSLPPGVVQVHTLLEAAEVIISASRNGKT